MTDKEIIIDGVNVNECIYLYSRWPNSLPRETCGLFDSDNPYDDDNNHLCKYNPNCYFKQLARKTVECEKLKEQLQANQPTGICETCMAKAILQNDKYRKALDEIFNVLNTAPMVKPPKTYDFVKEREILDIITKAKDGKNE